MAPLLVPCTYISCPPAPIWVEGFIVHWYPSPSDGVLRIVVAHSMTGELMVRKLHEVRVDTVQKEEHH